MHRTQWMIENRRGPRPLNVKVLTSETRNTIFRNTHSLKGFPTISVNQQFPPEINEKRKCLCKKRKEFKAGGIQAKVVGDRLLVNGKQWQENVLPPNINLYYYEEAQKIHISREAQFVDLTSTFQGYAVKLKDLSLYKAALHKLFQNQVITSATVYTHNIWAIKCGEQVAHDDDGEHGAG